MPAPESIRISDLVRPDSVHRAVYTDERVLRAEIDFLFGQAWLFAGHESQVPAAGDFYTTQLAGQPVLLIRHTDDSVRVLHNRCPHRGARVATERCGSARLLRCCYHGWTFKTDGSLQSIPSSDSYLGTGVTPDDPAWHMRPVRSENYRGFVFATLNENAPDLETFLGDARLVLDNMVERSPEQQLEVGGGCFRTLQRNNWKIYLENMHDGMHPTFVHQSSVAASLQQEREYRANHQGELPLRLRIVAANNQNLDAMKGLKVTCHPFGHSDMRGFRDPRGDDAVFTEYAKTLEQSIGSRKAESVLDCNFHNASIYPNLSLHPSFMQLRVLTPVAVDRTLVEIWTLRIKGAPEEFNRRNIVYANTVHSPSSIIKPDDLEAYQRVQEGLHSSASEWLSQHSELEQGADDSTGTALSEHYIRNQYRAWAQYMDGHSL